MHKENRYFTIGIVALGSYLAIRALKPISYDPGKTKRYIGRLLMQIVQFGVNGQELLLRIKISNPNPTPIKIESLVGRVYVNSKLIGDVAFYNGLIPATADSSILLRVRFTNTNLVSQILNFFLGGARGSVIDFVGNMSANGEILAVREQFKI